MESDGVNQQLRDYFSNVQLRHHEQLALLDAVSDQIEQARSALTDSQASELDEFREMKRRIESILGKSSSGQKNKTTSPR